jgi:hypothetical protein
MNIRAIEVDGFRGFATKQRVELAVPDGRPGSGLTIIVGPNNAGKSTINEALRFFGAREPHSFSVGQRNANAGDRVDLRIEYDNGSDRRLYSARTGASESLFDPRISNDPEAIIALPSRRYFAAHFHGRSMGRGEYAVHLNRVGARGSIIDAITSRLFKVQENPAAFNDVLGKLVDPVPEWVIDRADLGQHFLKFNMKGLHHNSEGLGEGYVSLLFLVDALYDSQDGQLIAVDEPELSLHPALQRRLADLFIEYSSSRQIVLSTHSPYFLPMHVLINGARVVRVASGVDGSRVWHLSPGTAERLTGLLTDLNNPHVLGLDAREVFFLEDRVILVEGQDDVLFYPQMATQLDNRFEGALFGWGVGGATKMTIIAAVLQELGFERVVGILDSDKPQVRACLEKQFPKFKFFCIPTIGMRTRGEQKSRPAVVGLLDRESNVRPEYRADACKLVDDVNAALKGDEKTEQATEAD